MYTLRRETKRAPAFSPGVCRVRAMKNLKDISLIASVCVALMAIAIAASPSMEVGCQGQSSFGQLSQSEAPTPTGNMFYGPDSTSSGFASGLDQQSVPCDSGGVAHSHACHSHTLASASSLAITHCSPALVLVANHHFASSGNVQPPAKPPRFSA